MIKCPPMNAPSHHRRRRTLYRFLTLVGVSAALLTVAARAEYLLLPDLLQPWEKLVYRVVFWILLLPRTLAQSLFPYVEHHYPPGHWIAVALLTPVYLYIVFKIALWLRRRWAREPLREHPAHPTVDESRRAFLRRSVTAVGATSIVGAGGYSVLLEPGALHVRRYRIAIAGLPPSLAGLRLVHIADTHLGPYITLPYLEGVIERANTLRPDVVLLTGDYVHRSPATIPAGVGVMRGLRPRVATLAVLGNHDHWEGADRCREAFDRIGIPVLDNRRFFLDPARRLSPEAPASGLCLAGVDDLWEGEVRPDQALGGVPPAMPRLLLSHNPDVAETLTGEHRVDLMLCGHTHGGQVVVPFYGPPIVPSRFGMKYAGGLNQGPHCRVMTTRGAGMAFIPVRFNCPPEIGLIELVPALKK